MTELSWRRSCSPTPGDASGAHGRGRCTTLCAAPPCSANPALLRALLATGVELRYSSRHAATQTSSALHAALEGPEPYLALELVEYAAETLRVACGDSVAAAEARTRDLLDARDGHGCTPLHIAAAAGETAIAGELISRGADADALDNLGRSPLHMAARYGRLDTVRYLVRLGVDTGTIREELWKGGELATAELGSYRLISGAVETGGRRG